MKIAWKLVPKATELASKILTPSILEANFSAFWTIWKKNFVPPFKMTKFGQNTNFDIPP